MLRRAPAALLALCALLLAACTGTAPEDLLARAPDALEAAGTSRFEMSVASVREDGQELDPFVAEGEQDLRSGAMRMSFDLGDGTRTDTLLDGTLVYLRSPLFVLFTGDETLWVRIDLASAGERAGLDADELVPGNAGPIALLQQLHGAAEDVEELGDEEIRGVGTTHLRVTVDAQRAIDQAPEETREQLRSYAEATSLPDRYPMEVWIDEDGLPRRIRTVIEVDEEGGPVTQETTLELYDFGAEVDVAAPAEDDVVDLEQVLEQLEALEQELDALEDEPTDGDAGTPGDDDSDGDGDGADDGAAGDG